ncbi:MAG: PHP domain-containing protein [Bacillota bacterium]|nr:PHP domain-containing protein [Bacillota bacterium]
MYDLHIHTTASDGTLTPAEVVRKAREAALTGIGITDHDAIEGITSAISWGKAMEIDIVPGIELSTHWNDMEIHVLGYFIDYNSEQLLEMLTFLKQKRLERIKKIAIKAIQLGYPITAEEIEQIAEGRAVGRPHLAQLLMKKGYISSIEEGFQRFLTKGKPMYVPRYKITPTEAISIIKGAKGVPVLAHPSLYNPTWVVLLNELVEAGLEGIEVYYPGHTNACVAELTKVCTLHNLVLTGGSDFHGIDVKANKLGSFGVSDLNLAELKGRKKRV